jgi:hypothetical protein
LVQSIGLDKKAAMASGSFPASIPLDAQERRVDQRKIGEMRHAVGAHYFDFIPGRIVTLASSVGTRDLAIGAGDTELPIVAGMRAAAVLSIRVFLVRGGGKANEQRALDPSYCPSSTTIRERSRHPCREKPPRRSKSRKGCWTPPR